MSTSRRPTSGDASGVEEALEVAAGGRLPHGFSDGRRTASHRDVEATRRTVMRFLENVPDELTVMDLREALEP